MPELSDEAIIRLLAEKVMGWKVFPLSVRDGYSEWQGPKLIQNVAEAWNYFSDPLACALWNPLVSIADAFMVMEKLRADGRSYRITGSGKSGEAFCCEAFCCRITIPFPVPGHHVIATGETAPRAMCLAAIAAIEESANA